MATTVTFNGQSYTIPDQGDSGAWGKLYKLFLQAVASGAVSASGTATLSNKTLAAPVADTLHVTASSSAVGASGKTVLRHTTGGLLQASLEGARYRSLVPDLAVYNAMDYGANGACYNLATNTAAGTLVDDGPAIQAAINAAIADGNGHVYIPAGTYYINTPLTIASVTGFHLVGAGQRKTFLFTGPGCDNHHVITVKNCQYVEVAGFTGVGRGSQFRSATTQAAIASAIGGSTALPVPISFLASLFDYQGGSYTYVPTGNYFHDLEFGGSKWATGDCNMLRYGILYDHVDSNDLNNSEGTHERITITNCYSACARIHGTQAKVHTFRDCSFAASNVGVDNADGQFQWFGGSCTAVASTGVAFMLGQANDAIIIEGCSIESQGRAFDSSTNSTRNAAPVTIRGCRIDASGMNSDQRFALFVNLGPYIFEGNTFFGINDANPPKILFYNSENAECSVRFAHNQVNGVHPILQDMAAWGVPCPNAGHVEEVGNVYFDATGATAGAVGSFSRVENGPFTISDTATTSGTISFRVDTIDTNYDIVLTPTAKSGSPAAGAWRPLVTKTKSGFTVDLDAAPGAGTSITYSWRYVRQ